MALRKTPHPEEAAKQLSRRTHGADPADRQFPDSLEKPGSIAPWHQPFQTGKASLLLEKARIANGLGRISLALARSRETE
jgi:hypothetical protein